MTVSVVEWLDRPNEVAGVYFAEDSGDWQFLSYSEISRRASMVAYSLHSRQVRHNDVVVTLLPSGAEFVSAVFGAWVAGASVCPVIPPGPFEDQAVYVAHVAGLLGVVNPTVILTDGSLSDVVDLAIGQAGITAKVLRADESSGYLERQSDPDVALIQFTSGSTGSPRGVCVTFENLDANIDMIRSWVGWDSNDATASWLPLFHDMGLIGCLLASAASQTDLHVLKPEQFVRSPARWLRCFDVGGATLTAAPSFAFAYASRRVSPEDLAGVDFSQWKTAVVGAEPIDGAALQKFSRAMTRYGFCPTTFRAAYGLAEATLAATGLALGRSPRVVRVSTSTVTIGEVVEVEESSDLGGRDEAVTSEWLVGCGAAFRGVDVRILDNGGHALPEGCIGQISIRGDLVAAGYFGGEEGGGTRFQDGQLLTGDAGFLRDGELFVLGRIGESVKVRGKNVFVEDVESRIASRTQLSLGQFAIIASPEPSGQAILMISERSPGVWVDECQDVLQQEFSSQVSVRIVCCERGTIRRTSSGKPRRRLMWEMYGSGDISGVEVSPTSAESEPEMSL